MGTLISKYTSTAAICEHLDLALTNGLARGGKFAELAAETLLPMHTAISAMDTELATAKKDTSAAEAARDVAKANAVLTIHRVHDAMWNDIGRSRNDAVFMLLFPEGCTPHTEGELSELPDRIELLARLMEKNPHPKLSNPQLVANVETLRAAGSALFDALSAFRAKVVNLSHLKRTKTAMGRSAQVTLANYKRSLKNAGYTEVEIHDVIPVRPKASTKKVVKEDAPAIGVLPASGKDVQTDAPQTG